MERKKHGDVYHGPSHQPPRKRKILRRCCNSRAQMKLVLGCWCHSREPFGTFLRSTLQCSTLGSMRQAHSISKRRCSSVPCCFVASYSDLQFNNGS